MEKRLKSLEKYIVTLEQRIETLESELSLVLSHLSITPVEEIVPFKKNTPSQYMLKTVYPDFYHHLNEPKIGFSSNREKLARKIEKCSFMFVYLTSPEKRIIGLVKVVGDVEEVSESRWPFQLPTEWVIGPKGEGVTFKEVNLDIRLRPGDTLLSLTQEIAVKIIDLLNEQLDLDKNTLVVMKKRYPKINA